MEPSQTSSPQPTVPESSTQLILPSQVWTNLSHSHQHQLFQTIVLVCRELLVPAPYVRVKEGSHE